MYTIIGYDKDNDVYEVLDSDYLLSLEAEMEAKEMAKRAEAGELRRANGEPFDWIEIYFDWNGEYETMVWASWDVE
jgi:hypothetical protein